jgi:hypothetical protein
MSARIAGLVQHFAFRETPMEVGLGQKLLRILDILVDMGDRRSSALQIDESFRDRCTLALSEQGTLPIHCRRRSGTWRDTEGGTP